MNDFGFSPLGMMGQQMDPATAAILRGMSGYTKQGGGQNNAPINGALGQPTTAVMPAMAGQGGGGEGDLMSMAMKLAPMAAMAFL